MRSPHENVMRMAKHGHSATLSLERKMGCHDSELKTTGPGSLVARIVRAACIAQEIFKN